jgi:hypothetical protein
MSRLTKGEWFDLARVIFWITLVIPSYFLGWLNAVVYVSLLSLWALVETAWAAFRGGDTKKLREIEEKIDKLLEQKN